MEQRIEDFETGEIHFRDKWQFELKSEFTPNFKLTRQLYTQDLYLFIPNSLQITSETYSKAQFYQDQTNLIRFKSPSFTLRQLVDPLEKASPLNKLDDWLESTDFKPVLEAEYEIKLFGNIFRSAVRNMSSHLIKMLEDKKNKDSSQFYQQCSVFLVELDLVRKATKQLQERYKANWGVESVNADFIFLIDFMSISINYYLAMVLESIREHSNPTFEQLDSDICQILIEEKQYRQTWMKEPSNIEKESDKNENILYQVGLLNKFVIDALLLNIDRAPIDQKYRNIIGGMAAALAMFVYIMLFIWQGAVFVINSEPFVLFTVVLYVLKDRLKDEIKAISFKQAFRWFSDYKTEIRSPNKERVIGELKESFSFVDEEGLPSEIKESRFNESNAEMRQIKRPEQVVQYQKTLALSSLPQFKQERLLGLTILFRLDIHHFLNKASDAFEPFITLDPVTKKLTEVRLPKVYHLNIVLRNSYLLTDLTEHVEIKRFRIIVDKEGIKRVENLGN